MSHPAVFLDRDGTLMEEVHYCNDPAKVTAIPGAFRALERLGQQGFKRIIITNQSGIGRGRISPEQFEAVQAELLRQLGPDAIDDTEYCPATPDENSPRRKPAPAMVFEAAEKHDIDLGRSWFVGDKRADIECGRNSGIRTILVQTGYGAEEGDTGADHVVTDIIAAVDVILNEKVSGSS